MYFFSRPTHDMFLGNMFFFFWDVSDMVASQWRDLTQKATYSWSNCSELERAETSGLCRMVQNTLHCVTGTCLARVHTEELGATTLWTQRLSKSLLK